MLHYWDKTNKDTNSEYFGHVFWTLRTVLIFFRYIALRSGVCSTRKLNAACWCNFFLTDLKFS